VKGSLLQAFDGGPVALYISFTTALLELYYSNRMPAGEGEVVASF